MNGSSIGSQLQSPVQASQAVSQQTGEVNRGNTSSLNWVSGKPRVVVKSVEAVLNASWWTTSVFISSDKGIPDWAWVKQNIYSVFDSVDFKLMETGGALVTFPSEKEV
ncbi:hypothetical protein IFM89_039407 [Coptis chinensis]|uniref:Uncharacterized protein n=1 Tax=Coptis chinensis TaxID=261450 RepID=A0A835M3Q8_9MAGN|nr:hypothetical protein IFM89_039407 [Coptis chinensis]